ncbi:GntR family transcriptional regulator [Paenibacillus tyrfis]|uniref:MocR-like pyridoxine biosynthesis transcription factor PdxR n=1 Tax=Paenibacillus tyrfis TaxID=1501230 RepID=UPI0024937E6B|nr:PLP-dependent aminotransferase family protein [Paenibacillus tyrfis]GLI09645.1 GntR family transcriptional regulator [Paenibacillus tyrfis]
MHFHIAYHAYLEKYPTKLLALYHALHDGVTGGVLAYGLRLPSTRELAGLYGLSRGTVNQVYEMLASEGYLQCRTGSGTYVAFRKEEQGGPGAARPEASYRLSAWGERLESASPRGRMVPRLAVDFDCFAPDLDAFPREAWNRCLYAAVRELTATGAGRGDCPPQGYGPLREGIARYLRRARGIAVEAGHIAVTAGSMQALALLAQLLVEPGEPAVAETPGYAGIRRAVRAAGGRCIDAAVDAQGIVPADWEARALFVTPTRQFPTGAVLSLERRQALLRWAYEREAVIVEDDYDSEFRHRGKSLEPLKTLDREERVVYVGSFTKTLLPDVRIGYAVLPPSLVQPFVRAQALYEPHPANLLEQKALAAFMASGEYERHLRRMKRIYSRKFGLFMQMLTSELSARFRFVESDAGLHIFGWWLGTESEYLDYRAACETRGVRWSEARVETEAGVKYGAYFNFPHLSEEQLRQGVERMSLKTL